MQAVPHSDSTSLPDASPFARIEDLSQLGKMLQEVRTSYAFELEKVAADLRLKPAFIEALESGSWSKLPGDAYGRGYLRQYAQYLGLSAEEALACCQRIQGKVDSKLQYLDISSTRETPSRPLLWGSAFALLATLIGWGWYQHNSIPKIVEITTQPPALANIAPKITTAPVTENLKALCLNIPSHQLFPCYTPPPAPPSLLLTEATTYPIWKTSWHVTQ